MASQETVTNFDGEKLSKLLKDKKISITSFAEQCGLSQSYMSNIAKGYRSPSKTVYNIIKLLLNVSDDELLKTESKNPEPSATQIIVDNETKEKLDALQKTIEALRLDLSNMAKMLIEINKTAKETKAQGELNHDEFVPLNSRITEVSSNVAKIYGKIYKKY